MTPSSPPPPEHAHHERTLVLRYFENDDELTREEKLLASALVRTCAWCAALGGEVALITDAMRSMTVPPAGRDFRFTPADARRARGRDIGGLGARIAASLRTEFVRPLAGAAVAIGITLAVIGGVPYLNQSNQSSGALPQGPESSAATMSAFGAQIAPAELATPTPAPTVKNGQSRHSTPAPLGPNNARATPSAPGDTSAGSDLPASTPEMASLATGPESSVVPQVAMSTGGAPTPEPGANQRIGALTSPPGSGSAGEQLPPLLIFGVLIAIVGLLVVGLTVVAQRMESGGR